MALYVTHAGIARRDGDDLVVLDLPHPHLGALLDDADGLARIASAPTRTRLPASAPLLPPFPNPGKIWVAGLNYAGHAAEAGATERPKRPLVYLCPGSAAIGPGDHIQLPDVAPGAVDYEGEVAVVIGRRATRVDASNAWDHVAGVTACNDVTARDVQGWALKGGGVDIALSKSFDTFKPLGPGLITTGELGDRDDIAVRTIVNGAVRQEDRTSNLIFGVGELIEYISRFTTLDPGDVISTGSPAGVGFVSGSYLRPDDVIQVEVGSGLGRLTNRVTA